VESGACVVSLASAAETSRGQEATMGIYRGVQKGAAVLRRRLARKSRDPLPSLRVESRGTTDILHLTGRLTLNTSHAVEGPLAEAVRAAGQHVVVNLAACPYLDTSGIAILVANLKRARTAGQELLLAGVGPQVLSVLQAARLVRVFTICRNVEEAVGLTKGTPEEAHGLEGHAPIDGGASA
jgi:anti-sigma B factor antagonist